MNFKLVLDSPPLREEPAGVLRIGKTRVLLELVIWAFQDGANPDEIVTMYDTLSLREVYAVIAFYLQHTADVDEYLARRVAEGDAAQARAPALNERLVAIRDIIRERRRNSQD